MIRNFLSLEWLRQTQPKCSDCKQDRDHEVPMEPDEVWHPTLVAYVDAWVCPECDRQVMRGDDPTVTTPDGERL